MLKKQINILILMAVVLLFSGFGTAFGAKNYPAWVTTNNFVPPADAEMASEKFSGKLSFTTTEMNMETTPEGKLVRHPWAWWGVFDFLANQDPEGAVPLFELDAKLFPGLEAEFFTTEKGDLVPVERGIIRKPIKDRTASFWELIVGPGKVWKASDNLEKWKGWNKAAFPFSLVQSQEGEAMLGLGFFYYKGHEVSKLYFQVSNDTAGGFIFWDNKWDVKGWGEAEIAYTAGTISNESTLQKAFKKEVANRLPMKPLSELGTDVSGLGGDVDRSNVSTIAFLKDDVIYYSPINTPFGEYPYPASMRVGVWSITKSLIPGTAALRLAEKYGTDFLETKLVDYFKEGVEFTYLDEASKKRWQMVTIGHALHMATGMGPINADVNWEMKTLNTYQWSYTYHLADQIRYYFNQTPNPEVTGPGKKFTYIDQDMWAATLAMERFLKKMEGPNATILNMLIEEVYKPIGVDYFVAGTGYTESNEPGFPYSAWGALPTLDYLAKAGKLIANKGMSDSGKSILKKELVEDFFTNSEYQLAFWKTTFKNKNNKEFYVPRMSGMGGNYVFSMPNGLVGIVLGHDAYYHEWSDEQKITIIEAANKINAFK
jgi:CubicO group peptidase (beta-lactamase class C family)